VVVVELAPATDVVVVEAPGCVVDVPATVVLEVVVAVVLVVGVVDVVVVVLVVGGVVVVVVVGGGDGLKMFLTVVPLPPPPKIEESVRPEISSMAVMKPSASTNTTAAVPAMAFQLMRDVTSGRARPLGRRVAGGTDVVARRRSVAGPPAAAEISRRCVSLSASTPECISAVSAAAAVGLPAAGTTSVGSEPDSSADDALPAEPVAPSRRSNGEDSGVCTTWRTASCPRSSDCDTKAVAVVATAAPMATPTMVPVTPKLEAMSAAITAPADEARIWRTENFTPQPARRRPPTWSSSPGR